VKSRLFYNPLVAGLLSFLVTLSAALWLIGHWHWLIYRIFW
jgi:hypothetical protein